MSPGQGRNNNGLEIGCLVDAASGLLTFTANGKELGTYYQVSIFLMMPSSRKGENRILRLRVLRIILCKIGRKSSSHSYDSDFSLVFGFSGVLFKGLHLLTVIYGGGVNMQ